jgi:membrane protease YdiL (CAAX protease family)
MYPLYVVPVAVALAIAVVIIVLDLRYGLFRAADRFDSAWTRGVAHAWLGLFLLFMTYEVALSTQRIPTREQLGRMPFYDLFFLHLVLVVFLLVWWLLSGRPNVFAYLNIQRQQVGRAILAGCAIGVGGWLLTMTVALMIGLILTTTGMLPKHPAIPPMIGWLVALPAWKKMLVVLSAMTIEEAFFRGWLQKRIGLIGSTLLFALAHAGYGQPLLLVGVSMISLVIGTAFYRTKNLIPGVIAHGIFDAMQIFVLIPIVFSVAGS